MAVSIFLIQRENNLFTNLHIKPQQKGKQGTKGAKQIVEENATTLKFYRNMAMGTTAVFVIINSILFELTFFSIVSKIEIRSL